ncbi:MAG: nickel-dependent hydrogenase large subunit [bacterium]|nr:nickel-dependent hydrogenase large subunit [bacterium]
MHNIDIDFDISLDEIAKIEGAASLDIKIRKGKIEDLKFSINEWKRFYTQAILGKPAVAVPQLVARICGTCSNAHLLASIEAVENAFNITPSDQTMLLRKLLYYGLIIRDHALHLYIFSLPDLLGKNSILDFDEKIPTEHELLEDTFSVKEVGNQLSIVVGGRSVHAPMPTVGGFLKLPMLVDLKSQIPKLKEIRPKILKLIDLFANDHSDYTLKSPLSYCALTSKDFSFLEGLIETSDGYTVQEKDFGKHLDAVIIPYSQARGFKFDGNMFMVGAIARLNLAKNNLNPKTIESTSKHLENFPTNNLFHNNIAQAIEIVHAIDSSIEIIESLTEIKPEKPIKPLFKETIGVGLIEAPRGTLYYKLEINQDGTIKHGDIVVPTGQNQIVMEKGIFELVEKLIAIEIPKNQIVMEIEKFIRAFDPCMSCAAHFLKVKWK